MTTRNTTRKAKSFTLERSVVEYITHTRAGQSASERVNELLKRAIAQEEEERLAMEAQAFFREAPPEEREESHAFQTATRRSLARDED